MCLVRRGQGGQPNPDLPGHCRHGSSQMPAFCCSYRRLLRRKGHSSPSPGERPVTCNGAPRLTAFYFACVGLPGSRWDIGSTPSLASSSNTTPTTIFDPGSMLDLPISIWALPSLLHLLSLPWENYIFEIKSWFPSKGQLQRSPPKPI